jgi:polar amino acid transport system substrate-binding protein
MKAILILHYISLVLLESIRGFIVSRRSGFLPGTGQNSFDSSKPSFFCIGGTEQDVYFASCLANRKKGNSMKCKVVILCAVVVMLLVGCTSREKIENLGQLADKEFAVPTGTIADQLVLSKFPDAQFKYFNTVLDACVAVQSGKADAAAYDEPLLRNLAAKLPGTKVLPDMITVDNYGFAVALDNTALKTEIDAVLDEINGNGYYAEMMTRWLPEKGNPAPMPQIPEGAIDGILRLGTSAVTEPFSFMDGNQEIVGIDIEIARLVAQRMNRKLEVVNMDFGAMIPALAAGKVDLIAACITISAERQKKVLFSQPYYQGGIAALVKE